MGCDIHAYLEYRSKNTDIPYQIPTNMFAGKLEISFKNAKYNYYGSLSLSRYYSMFSKMANVRSYDNDVIFEPKGLPSDVSTTILYETILFVSNESTNSGGVCSLENANKWVTNNISLPIYDGDKLVYVTNPDWHSHSWLNMEEYEKVIKSFKKKSEVGIEYLGILDLMKSFDKRGFEMRLVFWFDN